MTAEPTKQQWEHDTAWAEVARLRALNAQLVEALTEIAKREGPFSTDHKQHCINAIENMGAIADAALAASREEVQG